MIDSSNSWKSPTNRRRKVPAKVCLTLVYNVLHYINMILEIPEKICSQLKNELFEAHTGYFKVVTTTELWQQQLLSASG